MLLEGERDVVPGLDVRGQQREPGQAEAAKSVVEVRRAHGHALHLRAGPVLSSLTGGGPVRGSVPVALATGADRLAAAPARTAPALVDGSSVAPAFNRGTHQSGGLPQHSLELLVRRLVDRQPGRKARLPER